MTMQATPTAAVDRTPRCRFRERVELTKHETYLVCESLALGERTLERAGRGEEAAQMGRLFELLEDRLGAVDVGPPAAAGAGGQAVPGSNSRARELMQ